MPKIVKQLTIEIKLQRFLDACNDEEIYELWLLAVKPPVSKYDLPENKPPKSRLNRY